jgi:TolB-like protein/class 3 adenylate cyclase
MTDGRKVAAILVSDVVGFSRMTEEHEEQTLARLRALRGDVVDPAIAAHGGRVIKGTGDGVIAEFRSVVEAARCAVEVQDSLADRNEGLDVERRILLRIAIHLGDVVEEADGDLMGDGVNVAARLQAICEPGGVCLSGAAFEQVRDKLPETFIDLGEKRLKNIARPVRAYAIDVATRAKGRSAKAQTPQRRLALVIAAVVIVILAVAGGMEHVFFGSRATLPAPHVSIVVLPFKNLSNDPGQDYFVDGVTDNLTTDLSRIRNASVIARNTAFTYKGKDVDAKQIGRDLGVRYVLEGSVQREQDRVRVNAQLIDAETGNHLWADRFEENMGDLFKLQDEVVGRLANALDFQLLKAESEKAARSSNPDAIDLDMRAVAYLWRQQTKESMIESRGLFEKALALDPNFADAMAGLAWTYVFDYIYGWTSPDTDYDAKIFGLTDRSISLVPSNAYGYAAKAMYLIFSGRPRDARDVTDAGLARNPNASILYLQRSMAETSLGQFEKAKSDAEQALKLEPRGPLSTWALQALGDAELGLGDSDAAAHSYELSREGGIPDLTLDISLAAAEALVGRVDEAKTALADALRIKPDLTIKWRREHGSNIPAIFEGLRKAGLPEG